MLRPRNPMRRLSLPAVLGTILFGASVLAVSAQTVGNDAGTGQSAVTNQEAADHNDNGPPWERDDPCSPDAGDPDGRGGPPWLCDHGGVQLQSAGDQPCRGRGRSVGALGFTIGQPPGNGIPNWMRSDFACNGGDEDGGRGGPPWVCGDDGVETLDAGSGITKGPAWLRATHPGRGHGPGGDAD